MRTTNLMTGVLLAAASFATWAFQPLITDDTGTQGHGGNQLEFSFNRDRVEQAGVTDTTRVLPFTYTRGLSETLDAFLGVNHTRISSSTPGADASGGGNPSVGFKWRFHENEATKTSVGLKPELRLPLDEEKEAAGLGSGRTSYAVTAILTQETTFGAIHANLAAERARYRDATISPDATTIRLSVAPVWDVAEHWKLAVDIGAVSERAGGDQTRAYFLLLGAIFSPSKDLDFAFGVQRRTDRTGPSTTTDAITAGVTWRFK